MIKLSWRLMFVLTVAMAMGCTTSDFDWLDRLDRWETLGRSEVDAPRDRDSIALGREARRFRQLRLEVHGGPIELHEMVVTFGDGTTFSPNVGQRFDDRSPSRIIDLPGDRKTIQKVDFVYSTVERDRRATVILYGR